MHSFKEVVDALGISERKLCNEFGYSVKEVEALLSGEKAPSKIEISAFCHLAGVSAEFLNGGKADNDAERRVEQYAAGQEVIKTVAQKKEEIKSDLKKAGYEISDSELSSYFDFNKIERHQGDEVLLSSDAITANNAKFLIALNKAYSDIRVNRPFTNGSPSSSAPWNDDDKWSVIKKDLYRIVLTCKLNDPEFVNLLEPTDDVLMLFVNGFFAWDDKKVLQLINKGAFCLSILSPFCLGREQFEEVKPQKDVAKTLMLKAYLEERVGPNDR